MHERCGCRWVHKRWAQNGALAAILWMAAFFAYGEEYLTRDAFLDLAFAGEPAQLQTLWLTKPTREAAKDSIRWLPSGLRLRYWTSGSKSAWIMEEIGKVKPITLGVVVFNGKVERVDVLAFRESRGWEIRYPFFTKQFAGLTLRQDGYLSESIDGITGATLSVRAVEKVTRAALWLDARIERDTPDDKPNVIADDTPRAADPSMALDARADFKAHQ
ncbi:MAG: FMN-binding protein [Halioglobus sp.]